MGGLLWILISFLLVLYIDRPTGWALAPKLASDSDYRAYKKASDIPNQHTNKKADLDSSLNKTRCTVATVEYKCSTIASCLRFCSVLCGDCFALSEALPTLVLSGPGAAIRPKTFLHGPALYRSNPVSEVSLHGSLLN